MELLGFSAFGVLNLIPRLWLLPNTRTVCTVDTMRETMNRKRELRTNTLK